MNIPETAIIVDVRTKEEFDAGHIRGALNVNLYDPEFLARMRTLGDGPFFLYCRSGARSGYAVAMLAQAGLSATDLPGGIVAHPELLE